MLNYGVIILKEQILDIISGKHRVVGEENKSSGIQLKLNNDTIINCFNMKIIIYRERTCKKSKIL